MDIVDAEWRRRGIRPIGNVDLLTQAAAVGVRTKLMRTRHSAKNTKGSESYLNIREMHLEKARLFYMGTN